jgi:hypothetical protein
MFKFFFFKFSSGLEKHDKYLASSSSSKRRKSEEESKDSKNYSNKTEIKSPNKKETNYNIHNEDDNNIKSKYELTESSNNKKRFIFVFKTNKTEGQKSTDDTKEDIKKTIVAKHSIKEEDSVLDPIKKTNHIQQDLLNSSSIATANKQQNLLNKVSSQQEQVNFVDKPANSGNVEQSLNKSAVSLSISSPKKSKRKVFLKHELFKSPVTIASNQKLAAHEISKSTATAKYSGENEVSVSPPAAINNSESIFLNVENDNFLCLSVNESSDNLNCLC